MCLLVERGHEGFDRRDAMGRAFYRTSRGVRRTARTPREPAARAHPRAAGASRAVDDAQVMLVDR
jgi:hypothetical protein